MVFFIWPGAAVFASVSCCPGAACFALPVCWPGAQSFAELVAPVVVESVSCVLGVVVVVVVVVDDPLVVLLDCAIARPADMATMAEARRSRFIHHLLEAAMSLLL
ncbi:MAG: hypothetical protein E5Y00_14125 [Mesorhizobium sp.]|uniref:hypothetical protein n=1 Tax=Mesorhizobium sp. TaxID=1871066 RepID=UPI000FD7CAD0|nr:hypothetical protein [Mesorhizobium sp.]RWF78333.1 MAG: hypothetical protein EOQ35_22990 [Mesorhizobium sp.]RWG97243.1 MAG: hypothetical protein EOQ71_27520 [Mesorhizobium sp.]TIO76903.1 MAG: hypothetical protein E5Y00_14125 [Mesorhizobium sp.]TIS88146.1 MAG: hypothetical protein E5W99_10775 [Mesorhizobium sp.]